MQKSIKQFPSRAPWLTLASFCRRQCERTKHSQARQDETVQPPPATFKCDFRENHDPTKFKQKNAFSQKMYFATSAINLDVNLMSFGSLGSEPLVVSQPLTVPSSVAPSAHPYTCNTDSGIYPICASGLCRTAAKSITCASRFRRFLSKVDGSWTYEEASFCWVGLNMFGCILHTNKQQISGFVQTCFGRILQTHP